MSKLEKAKAVPRLRFPEFVGSGEWEEKKLEEKVDILSGYPFRSSEITDDAKGIPLMRGINITEGFIRHNNDIDRFFVGNTDKTSKYLLKVNDLVIGMDGSKVGKNSALVGANDFGALLVQRVARLRTQSKSLILFIFHHINSKKFHHYVDKINTSSGIPHISSKQISDFIIAFPKHTTEQQKIADCLTSLDKKIDAQNTKIERLKAHKKGLMQKLFPSNGANVPALRFPEFIEEGAWVESCLSTFLKESRIKGSKGDKAKKITVKLWGQGVFPKKEVLMGSANTQYFRRKSNQFIYSKLDFLNQAFGIIPFQLDNYESTVDLPCFDISNNLHPFFLLEYVKRKEFYKKYGELADGGRKAKRIQVNVFLSFPIFYPIFQEQQKISDCLSTLDELILSNIEKLTLLKEHKKGLMQRLFP